MAGWRMARATRPFCEWTSKDAGDVLRLAQGNGLAVDEPGIASSIVEYDTMKLRVMRSRLRSLGGLLCFALILTGCMGLLRLSATTYFVATNGSDANTGTNLAEPFQTIQRASAGMVAGDSCFIRGGVYHETLAPSRSGASNAPILFAAYANEVVTIDAADLVSGWGFLSNGIFQASANWDLGSGFNQVFVDGAMMHQARYPNYGSGDVLHPATASVVVESANPAIITSAAWSGKPDNYWAGAWFLGGVGYAWAWQSARVLTSTGSTITVDPATETPYWWFTGSGAGFLWGQFSFLDADNEWHLQTGAGSNTLYLRIAGGNNPSTHIVEMKRRIWCVDINGRSYITVSGLNFWGGAVRLVGNGNVLQHCQGQFLSHFMIIGQGYYENGGTESGGGIVLNGSRNIVRGCTLLNTAGSGVYTSGTNNVITRNLIYNTDYSGTYACCLALHGSGEIVTFNTAHSSGRDILRPEGGSADIRFNDLSDPGALCKDLGVIYEWGINGQGASGSATRIANNWVHDNHYPVPSPLIYLDNYDRNFVVDHNVCWNSGGDSGIRMNRPAMGLRIYNNTLFNCADIGAYAYDSWPNLNPDSTFWTNDVFQYWASNNLFLASSPQAQLVDWTNADFRLRANSPAIDSGVLISGFTEGYLGTAPDLGAYEFGGPAWSAGVGARPSLAIAAIGGPSLMLTGSPDAGYYQLYSSTNLTPPAFWSPVTNVPAVSATRWSVILAAPANFTTFYRLQAQ
jgi:hypothetical protein